MADQDILERLRAMTQFMNDIVEHYRLGNLTRKLAEEQLTDMETELKKVDPTIPLMNVKSMLDEIDDEKYDADRFDYSSSEYFED